MTRSTPARLVTAALILTMAAAPGAALACDGSKTAGQATLASWSGSGSSGQASGKADIVDTAVQAGTFTTLAKALQAAGLIDTLKGEGPFTVFAPTDAAFAKLPAGTLEALLQDKAKLTAVLTYHVVPGRVMAKDVAAMTSAKTVQGSNVSISTAGGVKINDAKVVQTDILARNGVIHVIDTVILPPA